MVINMNKLSQFSNETLYKHFIRTCPDHTIYMISNQFDQTVARHGERREERGHPGACSVTLDGHALWARHDDY